MEAYRKTFIFFSNQSFREQELIHLGSQEGSVGRYKIETNHQDSYVLILLYENGERAFYNIVRIKNNYLKLEDLEGVHTIWEFKTLTPPEI